MTSFNLYFWRTIICKDKTDGNLNAKSASLVTKKKKKKNIGILVRLIKILKKINMPCALVYPTYNNKKKEYGRNCSPMNLFKHRCFRLRVKYFVSANGARPAPSYTNKIHILYRLSVVSLSHKVLTFNIQNSKLLCRANV